METTILWTDAEKRALEYLKPRKKEFLEFCQKFWHISRMEQRASTTGTQALILRNWYSNPRMGDELLVICQALYIFSGGKTTMPAQDELEFVKKVREKYLKRIREKKMPKLRNWEDVKSSNLTQIIGELLICLINRQFIPISEIKSDKGDYIIQCTLIPFAYKMAYSSKITAKKAFRRFAIDPICTIKRV